MATVRTAHREEAGALAALERDAYAQYVDRLGAQLAPMTDDFQPLIEAGYVWVAESNGQLAGLAVLRPYPDHVLLENLAVSPKVRGQGIGTELLTFTVDYARTRSLPEVRLYTNEAMTENLSYYARRGFTESHRATQNGYHRVFFRKRV